MILAVMQQSGNVRQFPVGEIRAEENRGKWDYGRVFNIYCPPVFETKLSYV